MQTEENELERLLRLAAKFPAYRPDFYRALLDATIFVLSQPTGEVPGTRTTKAGEKLSILNWVSDDESPVIPFFSSLSILERAISQEQTYTVLPARSFFEVTKGMTLVLNPKSDYGKQFTPAEVEALLTGGVNQRPTERVVQENTQVLLGQPKERPIEMLTALTALLMSRPSVKAAYLALMHDPSQSEKPHLIIGIEAEGDADQIIREAWTVAADTSPDGEPIYLVRVAPDEVGPSEYMTHQVPPFYKRS